MKLYVVLVGLIGLVPPGGSSTAGLALLRSVENQIQSSGGVAVPPHQAQLMFRPGDATDINEKAILEIEGDDVGFVSTTQPPVIINNTGEFVDIAALASSGKVRPGCLGNNPLGLCRVGGRAALAGRIIFPVGSIYPLEIDRQLEDARFSFIMAPGKNRWNFRSPVSHIPSGPTLVSAANGTLVVLDISSAPALMKVGSASVKIGQAPQSECDQIKDPGTPCVIVWVMNLPGHGSEHLPIQLGDQDDHFELFYDLLVNQPDDRVVPYLKQKTSLGIGSTDPPGAQCLQPRLQQ